MYKKLLTKSVVPFLIMALLFGLIYTFSQFVPESDIRNFIKTAGPFGPIVIILGILLTNIIAPLGAGPFLFAGFLAYGKEVVWLSYISAVLASIINFWLARRYGRNLVEKLAGKEPLEKVDSFTNKYGLVTLTFLLVFY
ncbi:TVP38/TMEM64 family protein [Candidatus Microgenomates bacterium]|nr:TVP38/TMEM64 family protein [Candidatus Microgenomates bacterium]